MPIKLTTEQIRYISLFESITGAMATDCVIFDDMNLIIFVVKPGQLGLAIGRGGANIRRLKKFLNRNIKVIEYSDDPRKFLENSMYPANIKSIRISKRDNKEIAIVEVDPKDKGMVIGKNGKNIQQIRYLAKRYFNLENVVVV